MPYLICSGCGLTTYSAALYDFAVYGEDACPRCDRPLKGAELKHPGARRMNLADVTAASRSNLGHSVERSTL